MLFYARILRGELAGPAMVKALAEQFDFHLRFKALEAQEKEDGDDTPEELSDIYKRAAAGVPSGFKYEGLEMRERPLLLLSTLQRVMQEKEPGSEELVARILAYEDLVEATRQNTLTAVEVYNALATAINSQNPELARRYGLEILPPGHSDGDIEIYPD